MVLKQRFILNGIPDFDKDISYILLMILFFIPMLFCGVTTNTVRKVEYELQQRTFKSLIDFIQILYKIN